MVVPLSDLEAVFDPTALARDAGGTAENQAEIADAGTVYDRVSEAVESAGPVAVSTCLLRKVLADSMRATAATIRAATASAHRQPAMRSINSPRKANPATVAPIRLNDASPRRAGLGRAVPTRRLAIPSGVRTTNDAPAAASVARALCGREWLCRWIAASIARNAASASSAQATTSEATRSA